jgi:hypothetical protein
MESKSRADDDARYARVELYFGCLLPNADGQVPFGWQPDHVDRVFGASADAVLLAATVIRSCENSNLLLRVETGGTASFNAESTCKIPR